MNIFAQSQYRTIIALTILSFALFPIYLLSSGGFQLVDIIIVLLSLVIFVSIDINEVLIGTYVVASFIPFITWGVFINSYYFMEEATRQGEYIFGMIQLVYGFYHLFLFSIVFHRILLNKKGMFYFYCFLLISCMGPWLLKSKGYDVRNSLSFNNPNQLGYYATLVLFMLIIINYVNSLRQNNIKNMFYSLSTLIIILIANVFAFISISRAGIISVSVLDFYLLCIFFKKYNKSKLLLIIPLFLSVFFMVYTYVHHSDNSQGNYKESFLDNINKRFWHVSEKHDMYHRTLGLTEGLTEFSNSFLVLCGNGAKQFFSRTHDIREAPKEVHNTFLAVVNNYGIIGGILFLFGSIFFAIRLRQFPYKWFLLIPLLLYNMSHNGIRFRYMWVALALLAVASLIEYKKTEFIEQKIHN